MKQRQEGQFHTPETGGIEVVELYDVDMEMAIQESIRPLLTTNNIQHEIPDPQELAELALFKDVPSDLLQELIKRGETHVVAPCYTLLPSGQLNSRVFIVLEGQLRLFANGIDEGMTGIVDVDQFAGLCSALKRTPSQEAIVAGEHSRVYEIDVITLELLSKRSHAAAQFFAELLKRHINEESHLSIDGSETSFGKKSDGYVDELTGLHNHRWLQKMLPRYLNRSIMDNSVLSLVMFEIDKLDETKNRHGYATWENLIRTVGHSMLENGRATDLMVHDQDERFVIILPNSDLNDARMVSRRLREKIGKTILIAPDKRPLSAITLSVGIVELKEAIAETAFLEKAVELMQQAKRVGGDWISELPIHSSSLGIPLQAG